MSQRTTDHANLNGREPVRLPNVEVSPKARRRTFTVEYELERLVRAHLVTRLPGIFHCPCTSQESVFALQCSEFHTNLLIGECN